MSEEKIETENKEIEEIKEVTIDEKKEITKAISGDIMTNENGLLVGKSLNDIYRISKMLLVSKMVPKQYDTVEKIMVGMQYAISLNLNPLVSLRQISVVNGMPSLWGDLPLGIVRRTGKLKFIKELYIDDKYNEICFEQKNLDAKMFAAICIIERDGSERKSYSFSQIDYGKQGAGVKDIWNKFEKVMFMRKARSLALKAEFSDILEGVLIDEYDFNINPEEGKSYNVNHDGSPSQEEKINKFNEKLNLSKADVVVEV